jgi:hypothetical protein
MSIAWYECENIVCGWQDGVNATLLVCPMCAGPVHVDYDETFGPDIDLDQESETDEGEVNAEG